VRKVAPTIAPTPSDCAYAAGLLDGEGCVSISSSIPKPGGIRRPHQMHAEITNTYVPVLFWLQQRWGGSIHELWGRRPGWKMAYKWLVGSRVAVPFLLDVQPYLVIKVAQVENALAFQVLRHSGRRHTEASREADLLFLRRARDLNRRGDHNDPPTVVDLRMAQRP